jgi:DNA-directed RNA polymerase specialized sigma24 family protein
VHVSTQKVCGEETIFTPIGFTRLLEWLATGAASPGDQYVEVRRRLVAYFERRNRPAAEDLADETLSRIGRTLEQGGVIRTKPPIRYGYVVAKFVLLEDLRRQRRSVEFDEGRTASISDADFAGVDDSRAGRERRLECLDRCLRALPADQRELVVEYYREAHPHRIDHRRRMAERLGITKNALAVRAFRIREALMACVESCGPSPG